MLRGAADMERYFSFSDAKNLLQRYQRVLDQIHETGEVGDIYIEMLFKELRIAILLQKS